MQNQQAGGDQQKQIMQIIQAYAQATQTDPRKIIEQLQQMKPEQQQQALAQMVEALQGGGGEEEQGGMDPRMQQQMMAQQQGMSQQPMQMYGGITKYGPGGATTDGCPPYYYKNAQGKCVPEYNPNVTMPRAASDNTRVSKVYPVDRAAVWKQKHPNDYYGYNPLSQAELSALAHQTTGQSGTNYYRVPAENIRDENGQVRFSQDPPGKLTRREKEQLAEYKQNSPIWEKVWQNIPNFLGDYGASGLPENSRLRSGDRYLDFTGRNNEDDINEANWNTKMSNKGYADGGSTYSGNTWFGHGGAYIPTYGEYAYGGPMTEYPGYFNQQSPMMYGGDMGYGGSMNNGMMSYDNQFAKGGININPSKKGTFTAAATKHGKSVQGYASQVLDNKENYSPAMVKKANFARNAAKWKQEDGGIVVGQTMEATPELLQKLKEGGYTFEYVR